MGTRKRVEEKEVPIGDGTMNLDLTEEVVETRIPITPKESPKEEAPKVSHIENEGVTNHSSEPINCLRKEKVIVRYIPKQHTNIDNPKHVLYGGLAENATIAYTVPRLSTGILKNVLTNNEKEFLERAMGLEYNALSIYRKRDNFWDDSNPHGIGRVTLTKQDSYLDLSIPEDYIKYKILLANSESVAANLHVLEDHPKATYRFVLISEETETAMASKVMSVTMQCYKEYGKIEDDADTLRVVIELLEGRPTSSKVKLSFLQGKINEYIQAKPRMFLTTVTDPLLQMKVLIKKSVEAGLIGKKNDYYFLRSDNSPLCELNEESTLNNAARFISSPKRQELLFMLQAHVNNK